MVKDAASTRAALSAAIQTRSFAGPEDVKNFAALQQAIEPQKCEGTTVSWVLLPDRARATEIFGISSAADEPLVIGRSHARADCRETVVRPATR
jgi:hypothetical protein